MDILILQVFVSLCLVGGAVLLFLVVWKQRDLEHSDRLALLPCEQEVPVEKNQRPRSSHE